MKQILTTWLIISINWMINLDDEIKDRYKKALESINLISGKKFDLFTKFKWTF